VAEMNYMSEESNLSLKGVPADPTALEFIPSANPLDLSAPVLPPSTQGSSKPTTPVFRPPPLAMESFSSDQKEATEEHGPLSLPEFRDPHISMWTASHAANSPTEDRSASLVNILLQPYPPDFDNETQLPPLEADYKTLIRLNLWSVIDGHGGGCVATYASEVLLPHIAASVSRALGCAIVDRGVCTVNGQLRDANALDLDGLIKTSEKTLGNPNSIHYRSANEQSDSEVEEGGETAVVTGGETERKQIASLVGKQIASLVGAEALDAGTLAGRDSLAASDAGTLAERDSVADASVSSAALTQTIDSVADASVSSVKTSVKTAASPANRESLLGTHSPREVAAITAAITESFLAVDEGWINSIDPVATHQTSCQSNGRWNSGACALVVFTIQRLDWTSVSEPDREKESMGLEKSRRNTSQNRDAARRRVLDYAARRSKSASSMSTVSSTSSITTEEVLNPSGPESEITETEGEDDRSHDFDSRRRHPLHCDIHDCTRKEESLITPPGGCSCHCYRAHDAILYTAHVGDCRAVMLGSAQPRTIKVPGSPGSCRADTTDDESSHHSSDETECLSSSDHDADSSEEEGLDVYGKPTGTTLAKHMNVPRRVVRQKSSRRRVSDDTSGPYIALPPLVKQAVKRQGSPTPQFDFETVDPRESRCSAVGRETSRDPSASRDPSVSSGSSQDSFDSLPLVNLPPSVRPIDLTTDHSAYNPAEVTAVLRRSNNAPRAISAGVGGGIKRVAGSLAVTRALGDAYLKTPLLSFLPYKRHAPYITARPEVNCRQLVKEGDKVLIMATDGVWERAGGEDALRWVRNFYEERVSEAERRNNRRLNQADKTLNATTMSTCEDHVDSIPSRNAQEGAERDLFEKNDVLEIPLTNRKRDHRGRSPSPPAKRRKRSRQKSISYNVADVIVRRVLNKVRRARNISSLQALMSLPQGRARRSKHDDITASVVDLSAFVS
jgi:serine/threonine protein phosphatase PrpC